MENDSRRILLLNRIAMMERCASKTQDFATHVHMSWPNFYNAFAHQSPADAKLLLFSDHTAYNNTGVLLNIEGAAVEKSIADDLGVPDESTLH